MTVFHIGATGTIGKAVVDLNQNHNVPLESIIETLS